MSTTKVFVDQRWIWSLTFENNDVREIVATSMQQALNGVLPGNVIRAERGALFEPSEPPPA